MEQSGHCRIISATNFTPAGHRGESCGVWADPDSRGEPDDCKRPAVRRRVRPMQTSDANCVAISDAHRLLFPHRWDGAVFGVVSLGGELRSSEAGPSLRSEEHTSELQSLIHISYAIFCLKKKTTHN